MAGIVARNIWDPIKPLDMRRVSHKPPKRILVANAKGGSGKTTVTVNIAAYLAKHKNNVALIDYDPQGSSCQWVSVRHEKLPDIYSVAAFRRCDVNTTRSYQLNVPSNTTHIVIDTPAGLSGNVLSDHLRHCDVILIPVVPSAIDIRAATSFIKDVLLSPGFRAKPKPIAVIANRVKTNTLGYKKLGIFLASLNIPFICSLRDTQHYVRAAEFGMGIHDFSSPHEKDLSDWQSLINWLKIQFER